jgi:hypothetical protein
MNKANIEVLGEPGEGWCIHCHQHRKSVVEVALQWPDYPDYLAEGCMPCIEALAIGHPLT